MFGRAATGVGPGQAMNGFPAAGLRAQIRGVYGWRVTGCAGPAVGSGSPVTGGKIEQVGNKARIRCDSRPQGLMDRKRLGGIVQFVLQIFVALLFLVQNLVDLLLQLLAIVANHTGRPKSLGLRVTARRLLDCRLLRSLRLLPITTH